MLLCRKLVGGGGRANGTPAFRREVADEDVFEFVKLIHFGGSRSFVIFWNAGFNILKSHGKGFVQGQSCLTAGSRDRNLLVVISGKIEGGSGEIMIPARA